MCVINVVYCFVLSFFLRHWDGGPPRYQNPPMAPPASEYERPPPYYYPGASDQD